MVAEAAARAAARAAEPHAPGEPDDAAPSVKELARQRARFAAPRALKIERDRGRLPGQPFGMGDVVRHQTWGEGEVVRIQGDTIGAYFPGHGEKLLKASFIERLGR
jgi:hypothetical protein